MEVLPQSSHSTCYRTYPHQSKLRPWYRLYRYSKLVNAAIAILVGFDRSSIGDSHTDALKVQEKGQQVDTVGAALANRNIHSSAGSSP